MGSGGETCVLNPGTSITDDAEDRFFKRSFPVPIASRTACAPWPANAGPCLSRGCCRWPGCGGRWSRRVNRVVLSTNVPIAELASPRIKSLSQWPGTARSSTQAGRSLMRSSCVTNDLPRPCTRSSGHAQRSAGLQASSQLSAKRPTALHVQRLVDRLVANAHRSVYGEVGQQAIRDLFRAPRPRPAAGLSASMSAPLPLHFRPSDDLPA